MKKNKEEILKTVPGIVPDKLFPFSARSVNLDNFPTSIGMHSCKLFTARLSKDKDEEFSIHAWNCSCEVVMTSK